ncbi:MAG: alpha/beta hydrolase, partial [Actinocatenispora sp.]
ATLVAALPGAPVPERYAANRALVEENRTALRECRSELAGTPAEQRSVAKNRTLDAVNQRIGTLNSFLASRTIATIDPETGERRSSLYERQFLAFDPSGAGQCAEVFGDLATARHVAVLIPGGRNGLDTFNALAIDARLLADTAGPECAVVAWLGYDSVGAGTASSSQSNDTVNATRARAGASALRRFLAGLAPALPPSARVVLVGHGFGTVLVAAALRAGHQPDGVVLVGSPGLGPRIRTVADLRPAQPGGGAEASAQVITAHAGVRCWALRAPGDAVAYSRAFGPDPAEFADIVRMETQGGAEVVGHSRYYAVGSESLDNLARVVSGRLDEVTVTDTTLDEELMLVSLDDPACEGPPPVPPAPVVVLDGVLGTVGSVGDTLAASRAAKAGDAERSAGSGDTGAAGAERRSRQPHQADA